MRHLIINEYVCKLPAVRNLTEEALEPIDNVSVGNQPLENVACYMIAWGDPVHKCKMGVMETGFFWDAMHLDTIGLYAHSSLNTPSARQMILGYRAPKPAADIVLRGKLPPSKYRQQAQKATWRGVVLALQNPTDRSVHRGSSSADYYRFVEEACMHYKRHLFLKLHPWNTGEVETRFREMASNNGCSIGRVDHSVIESCKFVLVYNSTFVVDCLIRGVRVAQYAPGYFYQCPGVEYSARQLPDAVADSRVDGHKLCDFLVWRYCFSQANTTGKLVEIFRSFAGSNEMFPLTEEHSYGGFLS